MAKKPPSLSEDEFRSLADKARSIRRHVVEMLAEAGSGHPGGSLSAADIITVLFFHVMKHKPGNPAWKNRDRFILSKGHAVPALYAALAECGYFPAAELKNLRKQGSFLEGHPLRDVAHGIEATTGSLGQGLSFGVGVALAARLDRKRFHTYVLMGDGEQDSGQIWEAAMSAAHYKLDNLTGIIDRNRLQIDGATEDVMRLEPLAKKWKAFGWRVTETDGHHVPSLAAALTMKKKKDTPHLVLAHTVKGKGVSFMENVVHFHGVAPGPDEKQRALEELERGS
ncbi:MAG: transketolase [bacterium]